jgi:predicted nucleotidyltransferase
MGSHAYGCNNANSDYDIKGVFTSPKVMYFPATQGLIVGFDDIPKCEHWNQQHIKSADGKKEYDFDVHNLTHFLRLAMVNNANHIDLLFTKETNVTHCSAVGRMILDARKMFPSKLLWKRFRGYASDQFHMLKKEKKPTGKRLEYVEKYGYDVKFAYHCIRLLNEAEQMLTTGNLDLMQGNDEYKAIRNGEWSFDRLQKEFEARKLAVESVYHDSKLPEQPDYAKVKQLLLDCLEHHYGSLAKVVIRPDEASIALRDIDAILTRIRPQL